MIASQYSSAACAVHAYLTIWGCVAAGTRRTEAPSESRLERGVPPPLRDSYTGKVIYYGIIIGMTVGIPVFSVVVISLHVFCCQPPDSNPAGATATAAAAVGTTAMPSSELATQSDFTLDTCTY